MNYAIQSTDVVSGKVGSFGFDTKEYLCADKAMQFRALTPVFEDFGALLLWASQNNVVFVYESVYWAAK